MELLDPNIKNVNGPVNVVRMEGQVDGINKIIYLFMDIHIPIEYQSECENIYSQDINLYLAENFKKMSETNKIYDFFLEMRPTHLSIKDPNIYVEREIYIAQVMKFFHKIFNYDTNKNKAKISDMLPNIRLHYADIRDYFELNSYDEIKKTIEIMDQMWKNGYIDPKSIEILDIIKKLKTHFEFLVEILLSDKSVSPNYNKNIIKNINIGTDHSEDELQSLHKDLIYLVDKMFNRYDNKNIKNIMLDQKNILVNDLRELVKLCDNFINIHNKISYIALNDDTPASLSNRKRTNLTDMYNILSTLDYVFVMFFARLMDIYFLRRFLDKKYITNAIVYTGMFHSTTYIQILIKNFDFIITHVSYSSIDNMKELNNRIKTTHLGEKEINEIFLQKMYTQCSDMTNFPDMFQ
ncbi:hypothetical protein [Powai lake megavirus]|uniref:Uncharacterized protein n=1 Tax=Powai lake megavirus TaxID=1842663 RepID=A0A167R1V6_9VIRU|nr:hypothetical protein QJ849_gp051 [Powai lake megavirus]ANB50213.1 hypothetical protein [Powai lake megavirus]